MDALVSTASFTFMFHSVKKKNASVVSSEKLPQVELDPLFPYPGIPTSSLRASIISSCLLERGDMIPRLVAREN